MRIGEKYKGVESVCVCVGIKYELKDAIFFIFTHPQPQASIYLSCVFIILCGDAHVSMFNDETEKNLLSFFFSLSPLSLSLSLT